MYRDDPLDDEAELRELLGDAAVDTLLDGEVRGRPPLLVALDVLRVLQGWMNDDEAAAWFVSAQRRLEGRTPVDALAAGDHEDVEDAARAFAAAHG
jgi:hypothetical protein